MNYLKLPGVLLLSLDYLGSISSFTAAPSGLQEGPPPALGSEGWRTAEHVSLAWPLAPHSDSPPSIVPRQPEHQKGHPVTIFCAAKLTLAVLFMAGSFTSVLLCFLTPASRLIRELPAVQIQSPRPLSPETSSSFPSSIRII